MGEPESRDAASTQSSPQNSHTNSELSSNVSTPMISNFQAKRKSSPSQAGNEPDSKRMKSSTGPTELDCIAPCEHNSLLAAATNMKKNVYLAEDWRERWCRCVKVKKWAWFYMIVEMTFVAVPALIWQFAVLAGRRNHLWTTAGPRFAEITFRARHECFNENASGASNTRDRSVWKNAKKLEDFFGAICKRRKGR